jgi:glycosyltransferase involved in cell wall biosynthesis
MLGTVGGLRGEKDHSCLLRALLQLPPAVTLRIVGGGALAEPLRAEANALGVASRVDFHGPVADTAPCYRTFGLFVLSSRTEQMPIAMLEAMATGLAAAIARLLADPVRAERLGAANRALAEQRYPAAACLDRFLQLYERVARRG